MRDLIAGLAPISEQRRRRSQFPLSGWWMGNKLGRRKQVVDDQYTKPQGLYPHRDVDHKKLRKLILDSKLAPCYPGEDDAAFDLEECPICLLYYPSINRSRCCMKGICTECFLQMKPPHSTRPTLCPFCKTSNYAVEYRGMRTKEEKGKEQVEEQKVIEAIIRMRQQERLDEEEKMQKRQEAFSSSRTITPGEVEFHEIPCNSVSVSSYKNSVQNGELASSSSSSSQTTGVLQARRRSHLFLGREDELDIDLEEIMVMEAIWLSIQEQGRNKNGCSSPDLLLSEDRSVSHALVPCETSSSGLACAVATLAEHQHRANMDLAGSSEASAVAFDMLQNSSHLPSEDERLMSNYPPDICFEVSPGSERAMCREEGWDIDRGSAEAEASYAGSTVPVDRGLDIPPFQDGGGVPSGRIIPDAYEQITTHGMTWM